MKFAGDNGIPSPSLCRETCRQGYVVTPLEENCCYGCQRCPANAIVIDGTRCQECSLTTWPDEQFKNCIDIKPTYIRFDDPIIVIVIFFAALGLASCFLVSVGMYVHREHPLVKATSKELSRINIIGLFMAFCNVFVLLLKPSPASCCVIESMISLCLTIIFTPTLLKVVRIYRIFKAGNRTAKRPRFVSVKDQLFMAALLILIQVR